MLQARLGDLPAAWQQGTALPPSDPYLGGDLHVVQRDNVVREFLARWHASWVAGNRRGCLNACCHESGYVSFSFLISHTAPVWTFT